MCDVRTMETKPGCWVISCGISGKPITESNKYGMFCEDMCELKQCKAASKVILDLIKMFIPK
jgi:hypothetical protein